MPVCRSVGRSVGGRERWTTSGRSDRRSFCYPIDENQINKLQNVGHQLSSSHHAGHMYSIYLTLTHPSLFQRKHLSIRLLCHPFLQTTSEPSYFFGWINTRRTIYCPSYTLIDSEAKKRRNYSVTDSEKIQTNKKSRTFTFAIPGRRNRLTVCCYGPPI
eukprot:Selendium_serpulae@DN2226_c0_g1_i1.p1